MHRAKQEIFAVDVIDVYRIAIAPAAGPGLRDYKPISAILKARRSRNNYWLTNAERMLPPEVRPETVVGNAAALPALNWLIVALILARLLVRMFISVLIGLPISAFVLFLVFVLIYSFIILPV